MFVDKVRLTLAAGKGGNGVVAWRREKFIPKGGPAGGDGGKGASIILETDSQVVSLQNFRNRRQISAQNGSPGGGNCRKGKNGEDLHLKVPCGTLVKDAQTQEVLFDFTEPGQSWTVCQGGKGGKGNNRFKSPTNQAPNTCTPGLEGEQRDIELELKLIADIGLIGMPNAGKSSLMNRLTYVEVKIGAYPFTTLHPNLGYIHHNDQTKTLVADIPGILEGAHLDKGLGLSFLRHIERTSTLVFVIDASETEGRSPSADFKVLRQELASYDPSLLKKQFLVVLNKIDVEGARENATLFQKENPSLPIFEVSALEGTGLTPLVDAIRKHSG